MDPPHTGFRPNGSFLVLNLGTNTFGIGGPNAGTPPNPEASVSGFGDSDGPPKYLVDLLERFGWRVVARPGSDECSYVAPTGFVYPSLPKVLESLMSGGSASRGASLTAFDDGLGPFGAGPGLRGVVGLRNSSGDSVLVKPVVSDSVGGLIGDEKVESLMGIGRQSDGLNGFRRSERIKGRRVPMESIADVESSDDCLSLEEGASELNCDDANGIRRSGRINGKRVPVDDDSDVEIGGFCYDDDGECLELPKWVDNGERKKKSKAIASIIAELDGEMFVESDGLWKENVEKECVYRKTRSRKHSGDNDSIPKKCSPSTKRKSVRCGNSRNKRKKRRSGGCGLMVRRKERFDGDEEMLDGGKVSVFSWLIDTGILAENEKVFYKMKNDRRSSWGGCITRDGVRCDCCKKVVSLLKTEAHRGKYLCEPWLNTRLVSGKSLMECQRQAWEKEKKLRNVGFQNFGVDDLDPTDDTCGVCADGGHLIICDGCPSTFHKDCLLLKALPEDSWYCPYCRCTFCGLAEHGPERARASLTMFTCYQCGKKYHRECAWGNDINELGPESSSYCGKGCEKVAAGLTLIMGTLNSVGEGFTWTLLKRLDEDTEGISEQNRFLYLERNVKLSLALSVLYECFVPLVDPRTGVDMISQVTYNCGSNFKRLNFEGFYTVILEKGDELVSVASLRIHGTRLAEMPFIGTRPKFRRQGMCRRLLSAIEDLLSSLRVEKLIIPAIADLLETWKTSFSFKPLKSSHKDDVRNSSLMIFPETTLLQKPIRVAETRSKKDDGQINSAPNLENELLETQNFLNSIVMTIKDKDCVIDDPDFQLQWRFYFDGQSTQSFQNLGASLGEVDVVSVSNRHRCVQTSSKPNNVDSLVSTRS